MKNAITAFALFAVAALAACASSEYADSGRRDGSGQSSNMDRAFKSRGSGMRLEGGASSEEFPGTGCCG